MSIQAPTTERKEGGKEREREEETGIERPWGRIIKCRKK